MSMWWYIAVGLWIGWLTWLRIAPRPIGPRPVRVERHPMQRRRPRRGSSR